MHCKTTFFSSACVIALALLCGAGCDESQRRSDDVPTVATAPAEPAMPVIHASALKLNEPTPACPGFATGRVMDREGKPITVPGVRIEVILSGVLDETQGRVTVPVQPNPDGVYIARLKPGTYLLPKARIEFSFNGSQYRLPLSPHGASPKRQEASEGVVQDFIWKLDGPRPGETADKSRPETFIGGTITPEYRSYLPELRRVVKNPPPSTRLQFTLIPKSLLADGSTGQARVAMRNYDPTQTRLTEAPIIDLPLAMWEVRGEEIFPDDTRAPLLFLDINGKWHQSVTGTFKADLAESALKPVHITFTRKE